MKVSKQSFGTTQSGENVELFTLSNGNQVTVQITNYGAIIISIKTPDKQGKIDNIVCGFESLSEYLSEAYLGSYPYFGAIIGRCGNRIAKGKFTLDGEEYSLAVNNGPNHLHGGLEGFDKKVWEANMIEEEGYVGVELTYVSTHMEEGYPGNLKVSCKYTLNEENELGIEYFATTDQKTIINLTNHSYFNLTGGKENILNHELELTAKSYTESVDLIPTGKIVPVDGTPFDFTTRKTIKQNIRQLPEGYDLNFVLDNPDGLMVYAGQLSEETTGRSVKVFTSQPGIQVYTGYWIPELDVNGEKKFGSYSGVALETQHYPDSINQENFPSVILKPGEKYNEKTVYQFGVV